MKIISWNVNGIVACRRKGFLRFLADTKPDIMCCQEIKTQCELNTPGYHQFWNPARHPGYSGTLTLARQLPLSWSTGFGNQQFDGEGRIITLEYKDYYIVNANQGLKEGRKTAQKSRECKYVANKSHQALLRCL